MKIILDGEVHEFDATTKPMSEAIALERACAAAGYDRTYAQWEDDLSAGSVRAFGVLAWLVWRRAGRDVPLEDILEGRADFDFAEFVGSWAPPEDAEAEA